MPKIKRALTSSTDSITMRNAIAWCAAQGLNVRRTSDIQIKVGPYNCWPDAGTWNRDDDPKAKKGGVTAFKVAIENWLAELSDASNREPENA
ncbi:MAG: hypothetical protein JWR80_8543 [Bradyrhizobium sp.]|nr:hypothetical protein [Bradyrhizobium sp.]